MIIKLILSLGLAGILIYELLTRRQPRLVAAVVGATSLIGVFFVWRPDLTTLIAEAIGVGRGADLVFYCWLLVSYALMLSLQVRQRTSLEMTTVLAREIAILNARRPAHRD
jgi:hypothetical protein